MDKQFTASEVRDAITWKYGDKSTRISAMLNAFADLLEAREKAKPVMVVNHVSSAEHDLPIGMKLYAHPVPSDAERLAEALRGLLTHGGIADADPRDVDEVDRAKEREARSALAAHSAQAQPPAASVTERDEDPEEHCESGDASCGPVEFHDSEGVPLCNACWDALVAENRADRENSND